jgi:hypothetical protein
MNYLVYCYKRITFGNLIQYKMVFKTKFTLKLLKHRRNLSFLDYIINFLFK